MHAFFLFFLANVILCVDVVFWTFALHSACDLQTSTGRLRRTFCVAGVAVFVGFFFSNILIPDQVSKNLLWFTVKYMKKCVTNKMPWVLPGWPVASLKEKKKLDILKK